MNRIVLFLMTCLFALYCDCTNQPLAGGSSQQGNGKIVGAVVNLDGSPAKKVSIRICPDDYLQKPLPGSDRDNVFEVFTDSLGRFTVDGLQSGIYSIEANNKVTVAAMTTTAINELDSSSDIGTLCLKPYAKISGSVKSFATGSNTASIIQIKGLERYTRLNDDGSFAFNDLPEGRFEVRVVSGDSAVPPRIVSGITTQSERTDTLSIPSQWRYGHRFHLNTTATGADISESVNHFPVLLRLTGENFDFSQTNSDGSDVRFIRKGTTFLSYEIESWDNESKQAEVWIKVDSIYGNDSIQSITMFWDNNAAEPLINTCHVFDTSLGYAGVWHLNEKTGCSATDVSGNNYTGTYKGGLPRNDNSGIGVCQRIEQPDSDYVDMGNILNIGNSNITIGLWIKQGSFKTPQALIAKTNGDLPSASYGYLLSIDPGNFPHFNIASGGTAWGDDSTFDIACSLVIPDTTSWHYLSIVIDRATNTNCKMYLDGIDRTGKITGNITTVPSVSNAASLRIGTENDNNGSFNGSIAEATISLTTRSSPWVKLLYMNQKSRDALVKW
ncbi:MAG TPA: DUF2341 domain-containing protein [Chitinispirillaceae bacterium]|nr:DUF2341 domain-containing protein [Chitinispirillaceae bacterium]